MNLTVSNLRTRLNDESVEATQLLKSALEPERKLLNAKRKLAIGYTPRVKSEVFQPKKAHLKFKEFQKGVLEQEHLLTELCNEANEEFEALLVAAEEAADPANSDGHRDNELFDMYQEVAGVDRNQGGDIDVEMKELQEALVADDLDSKLAKARTRAEKAKILQQTVDNNINLSQKKVTKVVVMNRKRKRF
jgi:hypothetical protein